MDFNGRLRAIRSDMKDQGIELLLAVHDGTHFSGGSDALLTLSGLRCM